MERKSNVTHKYLRHHKKFPNVWCAGCGIGIAMGAMIRAIRHIVHENGSAKEAHGLFQSTKAGEL